MKMNGAGGARSARDCLISSYPFSHAHTIIHSREGGHNFDVFPSHLRDVRVFSQSLYANEGITLVSLNLLPNQYVAYLHKIGLCDLHAVYLLNAWTSYETWYVYHGTSVHLSCVLNKSLISVYVYRFMLASVVSNRLGKMYPSFCC
jgi:hypothetical protein